MEQVEPETTDNRPSRGHAHAPENTLAAFQMATMQRLTALNLTCSSQRRVPVVIHDESLKRTAGRSERVSDLARGSFAGSMLARGLTYRTLDALSRSLQLRRCQHCRAF